MYTSVYTHCGRILGLLLPLSLAVLSPQPAEANRLDFASLTNLSPRLEQKSELLGRRFDLVLARHQLSLQRAVTRCQSGERTACRLGDWQDFLTGIVADSEPDQLRRVNRYVNSARYITDRRNWERSDYWAIPEQLFGQGGDCEDYVIAKYLSLRSLGISAERLRIVVVYDQYRREDHAVLAISGAEGTLVLDNYYRRVMTWAKLSDRYRPYYSLNERSVWIHSSKI